MSLGNISKAGFGNIENTGIQNPYEMQRESQGNIDKRDKKLSNIPVNKISLRKENKFIIKADSQKVLMKSIEENGLIEPIVICKITDYLSINDFMYEDITSVGSEANKIDYAIKLAEAKIAELSGKSESINEDLENGKISNFFKGKNIDKLQSDIKVLKEFKKKTDNGLDYFIVSGHRRFKAYLSLLSGQLIVSDDDWQNLFKSKLKSPSKEMEESRWFTIPCYCMTKDDVKEESENAIYTDSNTTQRELTNFEIVVNSIDEMKNNGEWDKTCQKAIDIVIDGMSDRAIRSLAKKINEEYPQYKDQVAKAKENRNHLKRLPISIIPKTETLMNNMIAEYILSTKSREIKPSVVKIARYIIEGLEPRFVKLVYDGKLSFREARGLVSALSEMDDKEKELIYSDILSGNKEFSKKVTAVTKNVESRKSNDKTPATKVINHLDKIVIEVQNVSASDITEEEKEKLKATAERLLTYLKGL